MPPAAQLAVDLRGEWRTDATLPQFGATVKFPKGEPVLEADFPPFLSGDGRAPSPLIYCFYGALSCYASTYAMQAAMAGVRLPIESRPLQAMVAEPVKPVIHCVVMSNSVHGYGSQSDKGELDRGAGVGGCVSCSRSRAFPSARRQ